MCPSETPDFTGYLSVVVPVCDEADNILPLLEEIEAALRGLSAFEVIVADDGSSDDTAERLAAARSIHPRLRILRLRQSCGQSTALNAAVQAARHPWIATLDGDGQNDPADLRRPPAHGTPAAIEGSRSPSWRRARTRAARREARDGRAARRAGCGPLSSPAYNRALPARTHRPRPPTAPGSTP